MRRSYRLPSQGQSLFMNIVAVYNLKGGVGKTATAVNIAYIAARRGARTLLWDLDPQGAATWYLGLEPQLTVKAKKLMSGKVPVGSEVRISPYSGLNVLPADPAYRNLDLMLDKAEDRNVLAEMLKPFSETYSLTVLDCPPSFSRLAENVLTAADAVLVPLQPTPLSLRAFEQLKECISRKEIPVRRLLPFFSMVDRRRKLHREWLRNPPAQLERLLPVDIPLASEVERMGLERAPLPLFSPKCKAAEAYAALWNQLQRKLR